jgi:hypothetical protein
VATLSRRPMTLGEQGNVEPWLSGKAGTELLKPTAEDRLRTWPVLRRVKKTGTGDEDPDAARRSGGVIRAPAELI